MTPTPRPAKPPMTLTPKQARWLGVFSWLPLGVAALLVVASGVGGALRTNFADQLLQNQLWGWLYQSGGNLAECIASGRIAGEHAAAERAWE